MSLRVWGHLFSKALGSLPTRSPILCTPCHLRETPREAPTGPSPSVSMTVNEVRQTRWPSVCSPFLPWKHEGRQIL